MTNHKRLLKLLEHAKSLGFTNAQAAYWQHGEPFEPDDIDGICQENFEAEAVSIGLVLNELIYPVHRFDEKEEQQETAVFDSRDEARAWMRG